MKTSSFLRRLPVAATCALLAMPAGAAEVVRDVVAYYGVDPANAKPGVDAALANAKSYLAANPADTLVLYFPAGIYQFHHPTSTAMDVRNMSGGNLVLRGAGPGLTTLEFDQFDQFSIFIRGSDSVTVEQMHLTRTGNKVDDLWGLYTSQGDVTEVAAGRIRFQVHAGFPDPKWLFDTAGTANERTLLVFRGADLDPELDPRADKIKLGAMSFISNGLYDAVLENANLLPNVVVGDRVALKTKVGAQTFRVFDSDDCTIQDVRITRAAGNPIRMPYGGNNMVVRRVVIDRPDPINGRAPFFSGPGGGIQLYASDGGPVVEDCVVVGTADDGIAVFSDNPNQLATNSIVRRNIVRDNQARGILITHTDGGLCENNTLIRNHDVSIRFQVESSAEGVTTAAVKNWTVRDNTLIQPWTAATFRFVTECTNAGLHDNNALVRNIVLQASKNCNVVQLSNVDRATVAENEILSFSTEEDTPLWGSSDALVQIQEANALSGSNNVYSGSLGGRAPIEQLDPTTSVSLEWKPAVSLRIPASEDAYVDSKSPDRNQGSVGFMKSDNSTNRQWLGLVKFAVPAIPADYRIVSARLRIMPSEIYRPVQTPLVFACADNGWSESGVNWNNRPAQGSLIDDAPGKFVAGNLVELDVTSAVAAGATHSFYLQHAGGEPYSQYATRENGLFLAPELVIETAPINASYSAWIGPYDTGPATGFMDDPDGDGLVNLHEYALGGNPTNGFVDGQIPVLNTVPGALNYIHAQRSDDASLAYYLELTDDLAWSAWTNSGYTVVGTNVTGGTFDYVTNAIPIEAPQKFIRLIIE